MSNLDAADQDLCMNNGDMCKMCLLNGCNRKNAFAECVVTKGEVSINYVPTILLSDQKVFTKICKLYEDKCFVAVNESTEMVTRDCFNEYLERANVPSNFLPAHSETLYEVCAEPLCNDHDVRRMYCLACDSRYDNNCINTTLAEQRSCSLELSQSGCYHLETDHIERGCVSDLPSEKRQLCESDSNQCKRCIGNSCNSKPFFQKCMVTSEEDDVSVTYSKACKRYDDQCFIHVRNNTIRKGCVSDLIDSPIDGIDIVADCKYDGICELCSVTNNCNNRTVETENCIVCSSNDTECKFYPSTEMSEQCPLALKSFGCYLYQDGGLGVKRGCVSQLNRDERNHCDRPGSKCKSCHGKNCNVKRSFQICRVCESNVAADDGGDDDCMHRPLWAKTKTCLDYLGECYTLIQNGRVYRNCIGDELVPNAEACANNPENCKLCSNESGCNDEVVKALTCVSCNSSENPLCATNSSGLLHFSDMIEACPLSVQPQTCFHSIDSHGVHKRGTL